MAVQAAGTQVRGYVLGSLKVSAHPSSIIVVVKAAALSTWKQNLYLALVIYTRPKLLISVAECRGGGNASTESRPFDVDHVKSRDANNLGIHHVH